MNPFDMFGGDLGKMLEQLGEQMGEEGIGDADAVAQQLGGENFADLQNQLSEGDMQAVRESMTEAGISEDELNEAAAELNQNLGNLNLGDLTSQMGGADFNNLMIGITEQMQSGMMGKLMQKMMGKAMKKFEKAAADSDEEEETPLDQLDDDDLLDALQFRQENEKFDAPADPMDVYTGVKRTFYIVRAFMTEMDEGGLSQYLVNEPAGAKELEAELRTVHADEIADLLHKFLADNGIEPGSLSAESVQAYIELVKEYDFEAFDDAYYRADPPINESLAAYCRAHLEEL